MTESKITKELHRFLSFCQVSCSRWLIRHLSRITSNWWQKCVLFHMTPEQLKWIKAENCHTLHAFSLDILLYLMDQNWYALCDVTVLTAQNREVLQRFMQIRNKWSALFFSLPEIEELTQELYTCRAFLLLTEAAAPQIADLDSFLEDLDEKDFSDNYSCAFSSNIPLEPITEKSLISLVSDPQKTGVVFSITNVGDTIKYEVFLDGNFETFYEGQIVPVQRHQCIQWQNIEDFRSSLTAHEISTPNANNLYSLNSAKIDFVPYQFRPALKLIKADQPRILIADSVGVGKTIEAGLIIKELEARNELDSILIICPKPLVSERKWEIEMKRFDEEFTALDGLELRETLHNYERDGEWPLRNKKVIIPYSILDERVYQGGGNRLFTNIGLKDLDPEPHFDLVIVDEAHHIRNGSTEKEKAFAYKCVKYFCDHSTAVIMLTATPLQTGDNDLFTLLNLLRPDLIIDKATFSAMSEPNAYIAKASHLIRTAKSHWQEDASEALLALTSTQWGKNIVSKNPLYQNILQQLHQSNFTREERVQLISDVESLHTFNTMLNRTRRKDIQDFCVRHTYTLSTSFTTAQKSIYDELLRFEHTALSMMHGDISIPFMMSTIKRQASSCIFGLVPHIQDMIDQRIQQLVDDPDLDPNLLTLDSSSIESLKTLSRRILDLTKTLPEEDPKFDSMLKIVLEKQKDKNNKIILFSTFRYTLQYVEQKLAAAGLRTAQINGGTKDTDRILLRSRFELPREDADALDILLFTEVGSEGLDYQFCNMMINYDLPWNPMKIEQRIGRIDRRGQKSEVVNIYNLITEETIDADIYLRCLQRIGVFERSIGECEEILGEIGSQIQKIAVDSRLTEAERKQKLEIIADNEIRKTQYLSQLEDAQKDLFGFDLSSYAISQEIHNAESPWLSAGSLQSLTCRYLNARLGKGTYFFGNGEIKTLRLSVAARAAIREDFRKLPGTSSGVKRHWDAYLKGKSPNLSITFSSDAAKSAAEHSEKVVLISTTHPLVKQAANYFCSEETVYLSISYQSDVLSPGTYPFVVYLWQYYGLKQKSKIVPVCSDQSVEKELIDILRNAASTAPPSSHYNEEWNFLEQKQVTYWKQALAQHKQDAHDIAAYRLESLQNSLNIKKAAYEESISKTTDVNIQRMKHFQFIAAQNAYAKKTQEIKNAAGKADIHVKLLAKGVVIIRR